jgi:hypothetical protein
LWIVGGYVFYPSTVCVWCLDAREGELRHCVRQPWCTTLRRWEARGGSGRGTGGAGACGSASPGCSGRGKPNDGTSLGRATVWRVGGPDADVPRGGAVRRAGARERALASMPCFQIQSSHVWTPNSFKFENKL